MNWQPAAGRYEEMQYRRSGRSGLKLPAVSLGLWHNFGGVDTYENARAMTLRAFDLGVTHIDLANNYGPPPGSAEEAFGQILRKDLAPYRDELIISSKAGYRMWPGPYGEWGSRKYLIASCDQSLKRMGLAYVDIFYSHRPDPNTPLEETMMALDHAVRQGKAPSMWASHPIRRKRRGRPRPSCADWARPARSTSRPVQHVPPLGRGRAAGRAGGGGHRLHRLLTLAQGLLTNKYLGGVPEDLRAAGFSTRLPEVTRSPKSGCRRCAA